MGRVGLRIRDRLARRVWDRLNGPGGRLGEDLDWKSQGSGKKRGEEGAGSHGGCAHVHDPGQAGGKGKIAGIVGSVCPRWPATARGWRPRLAIGP